LREDAPLTTTAPGSIAISARGLVKQYRDGTVANRGIDLEVRAGEIVAIMGPNGAGKTTFLRQLTTELRPTSGSISIFGIDAVACPDRAKRLMGITPQEAGVFESLTVRQHLELFGRLKGLDARESARATLQIVSDLGLDADISRRVGSLSTGQRRRILIGLALLGKPPLLVLDEPTTGLDPVSRQNIWRVLRRVVAEGATLLLSTHYAEEAERLSDRIGIISGGLLAAFGTVRQLSERLSTGDRRSLEDVYVDAI
jgi:ABC-2 type transport system ATP-binding protein